MTPVERAFSLTELSAGLADGTVTEVTAAGTAAVITPVMGIKAVGYAFTIGGGELGKVTSALRALTLNTGGRPTRTVGCEMSSDGRDLMAALVLIGLGLLALHFGVLWAMDYRGMVTRLHRLLSAERDQLPQRLRRITLPPAQPADQRVAGVLLAVLGLVSAVTGVQALIP